MDLLEKLCRAHGISGFESEVSDLLKAELKKVCDEVYTDSFGNVIGRKGDGEPKVMIASHMDEVGFMVKHVTKEGYLNFVKIGGIDNRLLLNQRVVIRSKKGDVVGVIGAKPPHLQKDEERKKVVKHDDMFIDIGVSSKKEAEKKISVGDPVIFEPNYGNLNGSLYYGKAIDNRVSCYALLKIMQSLPKNLGKTVYAVGSAQEEVGLKGARVAAFRLNPDYAIAVDTTLAGDTPEISEKESSLKLGKGPAITLTEASGRGVITHPKVRDIIVKSAKKRKIPYQIDILEGGMTDAAIIYLTREGIPSGVISIPTRYIHGPSGVFDMRDVNNAVKLTVETIKNI
ncbi:MAG: M42 family metallopeptidase [Candidatus Altiarchaeota archaeon]